jgi:hypothetical protein
MDVMKFQKEFLKLAFHYLSCRYQIMTGLLPTGETWAKCKNPSDTFVYSMTGLIDHLYEMKYLCKEYMK